MANPNFSKTTTTNLTKGVTNYTQDVKTTDGSYNQEENKWNNTNASKYYGFYYDVGEFRSAIDSFATWVIGQGYTVGNAREKVICDHINGWGEDTLLSILFNHLCVKKFNGDAYCHIIREDEDDITSKLINLKPLDPTRMYHITNKKGILIGYEYSQGNGTTKRFKTWQIFHSCNNRVLDEPHGTSVTSAVEWVIEAIKEARQDWRRLMHRSSVRVLYVDESDTTKQNELKTQLAVGINKGEVLIIPCRPEDANFKDLEVPPADAWIRYLEYLEDKFYKQLGVPKAVLGGTADETEAGSKVGVITYEPIWTREIMELEADVWNQLGIFGFKINKQPSLMPNMQSDESKNTGQTKLEYQGEQ